jgi:hypothetical protein
VKRRQVQRWIVQSDPCPNRIANVALDPGKVPPSLRLNPVPRVIGILEAIDPHYVIVLLSLELANRKVPEPSPSPQFGGFHMRISGRDVRIFKKLLPLFVPVVAEELMRPWSHRHYIVINLDSEIEKLLSSKDVMAVNRLR